MTAAQRLAEAIKNPKNPELPAVMPYLTCGYPSTEGFAEMFVEVSKVADAIEVGVPFSDPMADGPVIQQSSRVALEQGVSLPWIFETLASIQDRIEAPMVLMSYLNPLMAYGLEKVVEDAAKLGFSGFIVPDLPWEESEEFRALAAAKGLTMIQLVTPVTPESRLKMLTTGDSGGFVYAVTITGTTGAAMEPAEVSSYLDRVRGIADRPVCAGFGIRDVGHVRALKGHADGAIVGSALIQALGEGQNGSAFVAALADRTPAG